MTFISYAQNYEDVMLWRALKHLEHGFYIDVGAAWPDEHSVTKAFYDRGWHGINVEPNPDFHARLGNQRPRDINLKVAVGAQAGTLMFNLLANTGLSTLDHETAAKHQAAGWNSNRQEVDVTTLAVIWKAHVPPEQAVHFLKVDVEGFEEAALRGNDWKKYRPWIVVVEATLPMSEVESHESWEPILLGNGYQFAYADGLNRFYLAEEHPELMPAFKYPPNVFDDYKLVGLHEAEAQLVQAEARVTQAEARVSDMLNSKSWKITAPLRWLSRQARLLRQHGVRSRLKALGKKIVTLVGRRILRSANMRSWLLRLSQKLGLYPHLKRLQLRALGDASASVVGVPTVEVPLKANDLPSHARQIHSRLRNASKNPKWGPL